MKGTPVNWTRDQLERIEMFGGAEAAEAIAQEADVSRATVYSVKGRIKDQGIDAILARQEDRYKNHGSGVRHPETMTEQLARLYLIRVGSAGRGGYATQYSVTLPKDVAAMWVAKWGRQVRFEAVEDGLLIRPVSMSVADLPGWLQQSDSGDGTK